MQWTRSKDTTSSSTTAATRTGASNASGGAIEGRLSGLDILASHGPASRQRLGASRIHVGAIVERANDRGIVVPQPIANKHMCWTGVTSRSQAIKMRVGIPGPITG